MPLLETYERTTERTFTLDPLPLPTCTPVDPFGIDDPCPQNAGGPHQFTASCGALACIFCARIAWP